MHELNQKMKMKALQEIRKYADGKAADRLKPKKAVTVESVTIGKPEGVEEALEPKGEALAEMSNPELEAKEPAMSQDDVSRLMELYSKLK